MSIIKTLGYFLQLFFNAFSNKGERTNFMNLDDIELDEPKQLQSNETRERIYDAAATLLRERGFNYLTVTNICKLAQISNGTFFYHFKTKGDLFVGFTFREFSVFRSRNHFEENVKDLPFDQRILCFYDCWADYLQELGLEFSSSFYNTQNYSLDVRLWNHRTPIDVWNYPGECLEDAQVQGLLKDDLSVDHCAEVLGTLIKGVAFNWCLSLGSFDMHERIREVMVPYLNSICKEPLAH